MSSWVGSRKNRIFAITPDWDNNWRTGGTLEEIIEESHIDPKHIWDGIQKFVKRKES